MRSPIAKFLSEAELDAVRDGHRGRAGRRSAFLAADERPVVERVLGALRPHLARRFDLVDESAWSFLFVVDFPLFAWDEDEGRWVRRAPHVHGAATASTRRILESDPGAVLSEAYDFVHQRLRRWPRGRIRIHRPELQQRVFDVVGFDREDAEARFGFLLRALRYGAPPHGGIAPGLDRMVMQLARNARTSAT